MIMGDNNNNNTMIMMIILPDQKYALNEQTIQC